MNSFEIQRNTEGLQIDKAGLDTRIQSQIHKQMILSETWPDCSLQITIKHFMCTLLDGTELVRNVGQRSYARHRL